jgi:hypothetical protein
MPAKKRVVKKAARKAAPAAPAAAKKGAALDGVFDRLRKVLEPYAKHMVVKHDGPGIYYLETAPVPKYGTEVFFGAVQAGKGQVSFHFMPIYVFPEMRDTLSPALRKRLRGTSKFTFTELDAPLLRELATLTKMGFQGYKRGGVFAA